MKNTNNLLIILFVTILCACSKSGDSGSDTSSVTNTSNYSIYVASGYPTASALGLITKWDRNGQFVSTIADYTISPGYYPEGLMEKTINGEKKLLALSLATTGRVDSVNTDGSGMNFYFDNTSALVAGTHRIVATSDGGYLISRTAGVERFTSARTRVGAAARYGVSGTCASTVVTGVAVATVGGAEYVLSANAATTPNNKINLYNGATGTCITGLAPVGPATTMWPVDLEYVPSESKLFVLYYPYTAATTNAQIWSFDVTGATINNGTLIYDDTSAEIALVSATPQNLSSALSYYANGSDKFVMVATSMNTVLKLNYTNGTLVKDTSLPFIYGNALARSISDVIVMAD